MEPALLIGNGLNRCYEEKISWSNLLEKITKEYGVKFNKNNSFSLEFESIINQILDIKDNPDNTIYEEVKRKIAQEVTQTKPIKDSLHELFIKDMGIRHVLTTNYDYMLELTIDNNYSKKKYPSGADEIKYSLHRQRKVGHTYFYHLHGEANYPRTLCLGYEHYVGYLVKMREEMKKVCDDLQNNYKAIIEQPTTWLSLFFTHDIYIVGFKLDFCEIDIWWLLTYRAYLFYSNTYNMKHIIKNKVKIFVIDCLESDEGEMKSELLKNLYVECEIIRIKKEEKNEYLKAYKTIANYIMER